MTLTYRCSCGLSMSGRGTLMQAVRQVRAEHLAAGHREVTAREAAVVRRKNEAGARRME